MSRVYLFSELKESKIIYDRKPPAFGVIITFMTLIFVVSALFWAGFSTKTHVVKASGLIVSETKINIMNKVSGSIDVINVYEGGTVKKGDVLIEINSFQTQLQIAQIQAGMEFVNSRARITERLIIFFNEFTLTQKETRNNPFDKTNTDELNAYASAQSFIDYINTQEESAKAQSDGEETIEYTQKEVDDFKKSFLSQQYSILHEQKAQIFENQNQLNLYQNSLKEFMIIAEQDGIVHLVAGLTVGTMLQAGTLLGSISSDDKSMLFIDALVSAIDRAKIAVDDLVEIAISGVIQSEFGVLKGKVTEIANDSTQTENGQVFYRVKIKPNATQLKDKKGNVIDITTGMIAESRIKYDETTWLKWAIEQIGIKFR